MVRRRQPPRDPHYWMQTQSHLFCALGAHDVYAGVWVRMRRGDHFRRASCEDCLEKLYQVRRPTRSFTSSLPDDAVDVRARQAGDE